MKGPRYLDTQIAMSSHNIQILFPKYHLPLKEIKIDSIA